MKSSCDAPCYKEISENHNGCRADIAGQEMIIYHIFQIVHGGSSVVSMDQLVITKILQ